MKLKPSVGILTNFYEFNEGYSLSTIAKNQVYMLLANGHKVKLFCGSNYKGTAPVPLPPDDLAKYTGLTTSQIAEQLTVLPVIPGTPELADYWSQEELSEEHSKMAQHTVDILRLHLRNVDVVFSHDWIFQGWYLPYAVALQTLCNELTDKIWFHWVHSIPSHEPRDWWVLRKYGPRSKVIVPTRTDRVRLMQSYKGKLEDVRVIPHIVDNRTWAGFSSDTCKFLRAYPKAMRASITQVYPASSDRLEAKGIKFLLKIFGFFKKQNVDIFLTIANQHTTTRTRKEEIGDYINYAEEQCGMYHGVDFVFTSTFDAPSYENGIGRTFLRELLMLSNVFVYPTRDETFGLIGPEAALSAGCYVVTNKSMDLMGEVMGHMPLGFDFGSYHREFIPWGGNWDGYLNAVALIILGRMAEQEGILAQTHIRQFYNWDRLYERVYEPLMTEVYALLGGD